MVRFSLVVGEVRVNVVSSTLTFGMKTTGGNQRRVSFRTLWEGLLVWERGDDDGRERDGRE